MLIWVNSRLVHLSTVLNVCNDFVANTSESKLRRLCSLQHVLSNILCEICSRWVRNQLTICGEYGNYRPQGDLQSTIKNLTSGIIRCLRMKMFWSVISMDTYGPLWQRYMEQNRMIMRTSFRTERITKWLITLKVQWLKEYGRAPTALCLYNFSINC